MNDRQEKILKVIVEAYVKTAEPVASKAIVDQYGFDVSPATVRNDMALLEAEGLIRAPHTSAGRVPTEEGYSYYISRFAKPEVKRETSQSLREATQDAGDDDEALRSLTKELVRLSGDMAIAAFSSEGGSASGGGRSFYTGMGSMMAKPDFQDLDLVRSMTSMLDRFDEVVDVVFESLQSQPQVMIGTDNPFGKNTAAVVVKCRLPDGRVGLLGLVGPMRMDYQKNLGLIGDVIDILNE